MRHGKKFNHLSRKKGHREATLRALSHSLISHKRINTTVAKAKALRVFLEPLITKSKKNTMHSRRVVFSYLMNKEAVSELFGEISGKIGDRPGGYLRIIKTGFRQGDGAETAMIEFVDYNNVFSNDGAGSSRKKTRRRGRGKKGATAAAVGAVASTAVKTEEEE